MSACPLVWKPHTVSPGVAVYKVPGTPATPLLLFGMGVRRGSCNVNCLNARVSKHISGQ